MIGHLQGRHDTRERAIEAARDYLRSEWSYNIDDAQNVAEGTIEVYERELGDAVHLTTEEREALDAAAAGYLYRCADPDDDQQWLKARNAALESAREALSVRERGSTDA